ncbi:MAG: helix-turn-helix transcriptional regulator [Thermoplasmata archaeon]|nr:helix-turn-helix transcriptional regulator [Thermoplasmata archaeon]
MSIAMREKAISRLLTDDYAERILVATYFYPRSVQEISDKYDIPIAACYRKMHDLEDAGLVETDKIVTTSKGKNMKLYKSQLKSACIMFQEGHFKIRLEFNTDEDINNRWIKIPIPTR